MKLLLYKIQSFIQSWYYYLFNINVSVNDNITNSLSNINGMIIFSVSEPDSVDISCMVPNPISDDPADLSNQAEQFAEMLLCINEGLFKKNIIQVLTNHYDKETDPIKKLLIDNILHFWSVLQTTYKTEKKLKSKNNSKEPLINPMAVFSNRK